MVPFALSIHTFINNVGAYVGFASIIGLALLVLLHFAQARETSTLRGRLEEAGERIAMLESRLAHALRAGRTGAPAPPTVAPAPLAAARATGSAAAQRTPAPAVVISRAAPGAPMGLAAPSLASATRLVTPAAPRTAPVPAAVPAVVAAPAALAAVPEGTAPDDTVLVAPATAAARGNGHERTAIAPPVAAARGAAATAPPPSSPPRVQIRPEAAGGARRPMPPYRGGPPPRRSLIRRLVPGLIGLLVIAAIVVVLLEVTKSPSTPKTAANHHAVRHKKPAPHFIPSHVTVAVLNGTAVTHLAKDVSTKLRRIGYQQGTVANAAVQTHTDTIVAYVGRNHRPDALHVARALRVSERSIQPADHDAIGMCSASANGADSCSAEVIVTVGTDLSSIASAAGAG